VVIDEHLLALAPKISHEEAASLPLIGLTVLQNFEPFVNSHRSTIGKRVLIQGGSGGVGSFAVQYCKHELGMEVFATCSTKNIEFVRSLGADRVIDYTVERFEEVVKGCDVVLDTKAYMLEHRTVSSGVLKPGGHYIHLASSPNSPHKGDKDPLHLAIPESRIDRYLFKQAAYGFYNLLYRLGLSRYSYGYHFVHPDGNGLHTIAHLVDTGRVTAVIDSLYDMKDTAEAHRKVEEGHVRGKVVIKIEE
jgi:alcohol dehydrogenase